MWGDCAQWLEQVDQRTPSVVLAARDAAGHDVTDVRVTMDGKPLVDRLDSRALDVDPGEHRFAFKRGDREPVEASVLVHEGEKSRLVVVRLEPEGAAPSATPSGPSESGRASGAPVAPYVLGGIGLAALGSFAYFGLTGRADYFALKDSCAPHCSASQGSPVATKLLVADISLGVSVVALGAAAYLFLRTSSASSAPPQRAFALDVSVGPTGASAGAHGAF